MTMSTGNTPAFINKEQYGKKKKMMKKPATKKPAKKPMKKGKGY